MPSLMPLLLGAGQIQQVFEARRVHFDSRGLDRS